MGSIGIQLAKRAGLTVIAIASRDTTRAWVTTLGADHVVDHREPMVEQVPRSPDPQALTPFVLR